MTKYAALFPGQGSQNKNMFESYEKNTIFNECITKSSQILGYDISKIIQDDSKLNNTIYTQPIMVATSIAMWNVWVNKINIMPLLAAGHSLGEYSALVANQTLSLEDCLNLVSARARFMVDAMTGVQGGMAAIMSNNPEMNLSEHDFMMDECAATLTGKIITLLTPCALNSDSHESIRFLCPAITI